MADREDPSSRLGELIRKAWADDAFKDRLLSDTMRVLAEHGIPVRAGVEVRAVENTENVFYMIIPPRPGQPADAEAHIMSCGGPITDCGQSESYPVPCVDQQCSDPPACNDHPCVDRQCWPKDPSVICSVGTGVDFEL